MTAGDTTATRFRPDIEGLRAVAITTVLLAHAGVPFAAGGYVGVDVFFVISGYLITRLLADELERTGRIRLLHFYARRVKRLLPPALVVLAAVTAGSAILLPPLRADAVGRDVIAAGLYAINWRFSAQAIDYFASGPSESPLEHFWSLAVEEQFYLAWPALLLAAFLAARRRGALWMLLAAVAAGSFAYAVHATGASPSQAYFSTFARGWELALGGLLALATARRAPSPRVAAAIAWAGAAGIAAATLLLDPRAAFPGWPALLPVLSAAALIAAGGAARRPAPVRALALAPVRAVGARSYAWYLWHWPLLVLGEAAIGPLTLAQGVALTAASYVPATFTHRWVERPARRSRIHVRMPRLAVAAAPAAAVVAAALGIALTLALPSTPTLAEQDADGAGRLDRTTKLQRRATALRPAPRDADRDRSRIYEDGCLAEPKAIRSKACAYGDRRSDTTVVLFGDSHAMQYGAALDRIAKRRHWRLVVLTKAGCPPAAIDVNNAELGRRYRECPRWRAHALRRIHRGRPAMVIAATSLHYRPLGDSRPARDAIAAGLERTLRRLADAAPRLVVLRDPPRPPHDVPSCVAEHVKDLRRCAFPRPAALDRPGPERRAAARVPGTRVIDARSRFCPGRLCPAVIGDVIVYRNSGHLTATYVRTMTRWLAERLPKRF